MNREQLKDRLHILALGDVISKPACEVTIKAFDHLLTELKTEDLEQSEMLFTHLPSAITRIGEGETLEGPSSEIMKEVRNSNYYPTAENHIKNIEHIWGHTLPEEEKAFLSMHYTTIIEANQGGDKR
ncbi:PRD domain-containing protein [Oceanobacillus manasiensis]|uniref:PRD domain-containing protein n=1 Tax=Oceanobacillus manasiensis TaxID=586413 RepID=UPI0005A8426C|nr:PRD domain-containing protein [Oceanobacillus manasiensis]